MCLHSSIIKSVDSCICASIKASHTTIDPLALGIRLHLYGLTIVIFINCYFLIICLYLFTSLHFHILILDLALRPFFRAVEASS